MVHSVAIGTNAVYALQGEALVKYASNRSVEKIVNQANLSQIKCSGAYLAGMVNDSKEVRIYDENLQEIAVHEFPKRPSALSILNEELVVADKFGDVFRTAVTKPIADPKQVPVILGHVSLVLDVILHKSFVFTSDRDEHVRVSQFPNAFVIEQFLLGHHAYVAHLAVNDRYLVSGGGDPFALLFDWQRGELLGKLEVGKPVIGIVICQDQVYILPEFSEEVIVAKLPSLEIVERRNFNENVTCLGENGTEVFFGLANRVSGYAELEGHTEPINEESLRKTNAAI